jgi:hypothetical protein
MLSLVGAKSWLLLFALSCLTIAGPAHADKRVALVVGNSAYKSVAPLANPQNDARLMADTLRDAHRLLWTFGKLHRPAGLPYRQHEMTAG